VVSQVEIELHPALGYRWLCQDNRMAIAANASSYRILAASYAHMGRMEEAQEVIPRLRAITPSVMPNVSLLRNADHRELYLSGARIAAGEKT
jgi:predicted protein tyrosine phosphatase